MERELLRSAGHDVAIFERTNPVGAAKSLGALMAAPWNPVTVSSINQLMASTLPSVAHIHNTWFAISPAALAATHRAGIPTVFTAHNYRLACINGQLLRDGKPCQICVGTHPWAGVVYRCYRDSFLASSAAAGTLALNRRMGTWQKHVDVWIVLTTFMKEVLSATGIPGERIVHLPNFTFDPGPRSDPPSSSDTVLFVGRLSPEKGLEQLLECWAQSPPKDLRLVIVGDGPLAPLLSGQDLPGVEFRGRLPQSEIRDLMLGARALVVPSTWYEGQPMVVLEAMSAGLGVVASDLGGLPETIGEGGQTVRSWFEFSFRDLIDVDRLGRAARKRWSEVFTPERHLQGLMNAYDQAAYFHNR
ncbi:MAG TPA: glycosyltransferase [Acidimicrobiia bacterium]|nr:glycosyltransferase [Acidimicrobiia bacterium]